MKVLITGGSGSLGHHLVRQAAAAGHDVRVLGRRARGLPVPVVPGDPASGEDLRAAVADVDVVIHAASDPRHAKVVDGAGTRHLLAAAASAGVRHFVYISIVGVDAIPYPYYRRKYEAGTSFERAACRTPSSERPSFARGCDAADARARASRPGRIHVSTGGRGGRCRSTGRLHPRRAIEPGRRFGGPEVLPLESLADSWMVVRGVHKGAPRMVLPGRVARAFREAKNTAPQAERGVIGWSDWLGRGVHTPSWNLKGTGSRRR